MGRPRVVFAEGHDRRVLRAAQLLLERNVCRPILIGDETALSKIAKSEGLSFCVGDDIRVVSYDDRHNFRDEWLRELLLQQWDVKSRPALHSSTKNTPVAARLVNDGIADCMICGTTGRSEWHFSQLAHVLDSGRWNAFGTLHAVMLGDLALFMGFPVDAKGGKPNEIARMAVAAATFIRAVGLEPRISICADGCDDDHLFDRVVAQAAGILEAGPSNFGAIDRILSHDALDYVLRDAPGESKCDVVLFASQKIAQAFKAQLRRAGASVISAAATTTFENRAHVVSPFVTAQELVTVASFAIAGIERIRTVQPSLAPLPLGQMGEIEIR